MSVIKNLRKLLKRGSPLPWSEDDGNLFSQPQSDAREKRIMARIESRTAEPRDDDDEHDGLVAKCSQDLPNFVADAYLIQAAINALPHLLEMAESLKRASDAVAGSFAEDAALSQAYESLGRLEKQS